MIGKLGSAVLSADVYTAVYTVPAETSATINIAAVNRNAEDVPVRIAITNQAETPLDSDFVEFNAVVPGNGGVLERTGIVVGAGEKVMVYASKEDMTVRIHGFEN